MYLSCVHLGVTLLGVRLGDPSCEPLQEMLEVGHLFSKPHLQLLLALGSNLEANHEKEANVTVSERLF